MVTASNCRATSSRRCQASCCLSRFIRISRVPFSADSAAECTSFATMRPAECASSCHGMSLIATRSKYARVLPQVGSDQFLNDALAAGLASGSPLLAAGQQTDFNRMLLFAMDKQPPAARGTSDAEQWQRCRWHMLRATKNPAALPGVVAFIARCLADEVPCKYQAANGFGQHGVH